MSGYVVCVSVDGEMMYIYEQAHSGGCWSYEVSEAIVWHNIGDAKRAAVRAGVSVDCVVRLSCVVPTQRA